MALPTSTIVMAVLTCIPFGLAIKDTVSGKQTAQRDRDRWDDDGHDDNGDSAYDAEYARAEAAREAAEAEEERLEALKTEKLAVARRTLFGAEVATLGSGFGGTRIGTPGADVDMSMLAELQRATSVRVGVISIAKVNGILIEPTSDADDDEKAELCRSLSSELQAAWGNGETDDYSSRYWINPTTSIRASIHPEDCKLVFEPFTPTKAWINKTKDSVVPVGLVGQPFAKVAAAVGTTTELEPGELVKSWERPGVGLGLFSTNFEAYVVNGKVVAITASARTLEVTRNEVQEQLTELYGEPVEENEGLRWKSRPVIRLVPHNISDVMITIGTVPTQQ